MGEARGTVMSMPSLLKNYSSYWSWLLEKTWLRYLLGNVKFLVFFSTEIIKCYECYLEFLLRSNSVKHPQHKAVCTEEREVLRNFLLELELWLSSSFPYCYTPILYLMTAAIRAIFIFMKDGKWIFRRLSSEFVSEQEY